MQVLLWSIVTDPVNVLLCLKHELMEGKRKPSDIQVFLEIAKKDVRERFRLFEEFNLAHFGETEDLNYIMEDVNPSNYKSVKKEWFRETLYLPFEHIRVPAPIEYDKILTQCYGNYHQYVLGGTAHENIILDPDLPYDEFFARYL